VILATPADAGELAMIHEAAFQPGGCWGADAIRLMLDMPGTFGLHDLPNGFVLVRVAADEAEILTLAVSPGARRRGLGTALVVAAMASAAVRGARTMFLEVSERNAPARALYEAAGFRMAGRRRAYYPDGADALVLRREFIPS